MAAGGSGKGTTKDKKTGGATGPSSAGQGQSTKDRNLNELDRLGKGLGSSTQGATGGAAPSGGTQKDKTPDELPPGLNPLKYEKRKTRSYEATPSNIAKVAGTIIGAATGPIGTAAEAVYTGYKVATDDEYDPLNPFEKPTGTTTTGQYDASQIESTQPSATVKPSLPVPPVDKKKKKNAMLGNVIGNLLSGAGGTLVAG